jgi:hypothetical protein
MPHVIYEQTLIRQVEVEVTEEQLAALKTLVSLNSRQEADEAQQYVINEALTIIDKDKIQPEFCSAVCVEATTNEELFDI